MVFRQTDLKRRALNVRKKYVGSDVTRLCSFLFYFKHKLTQPRFYIQQKSLKQRQCSNVILIFYLIFIVPSGSEMPANFLLISFN